MGLLEHSSWCGVGSVYRGLPAKRKIIHHYLTCIIIELHIIYPPPFHLRSFLFIVPVSTVRNTGLNKIFFFFQN